MSPVNVSTIGAYIREQREQARISLRQLAQAAGVSNPYLSQIERGLRRPSADILQQIAKGLRISAEALYVQAGILEDRPPGHGVREAVLADPEITERQKQMLLEVYESFRAETAESAADGGGPAGSDDDLPGPDLAAAAWPDAVDDAGLVEDAGLVHDAELVEDAALVHDAEVVEDAGLVEDAEVVEDAGLVHDAGTDEIASTAGPFPSPARNR